MRVIKLASLVLVILIIATVVFGIFAYNRANAFSMAISRKGALESDINQLASKEGHFNLLVMGYGGGNHDGAYLTDSLMIYSVPLSGGPASRLSIPRDLWIESPYGSGYYRKINAAYAYAFAQTRNHRKAAAAAAEDISHALGIPIQGWMTVDFNGFRDLVDALGGVDVNVPRSFTAKYPANDNPRINYKWITIRFKKGVQHMDGEEAIRYARARYTNDPRESSDFARAARQQLVVSAIKRKLLSPSGIIRGFKLADAVQDDIKTNLSVRDLASIFGRKIDDKRSVVLGLDNALDQGMSSDGQYILYPKNNNWNYLHKFVRDSLYGSQNTAER